MNWNTSVIKFTTSEFAEYNKCLEQFRSLDGTSEDIVHTKTFKFLSDA